MKQTPQEPKKDAKQETRNMPLEGQDSSHLTESRKDSQRPGADGDQQTERRAK